MDMPTFSEFMQATNFLQVLQGAIERAGQEHQRRKMLEQGLNLLYDELKRLQVGEIPDIYRGQLETLQQISPQLLAGAKTPQEVSNVMAQIYGVLQQTKRDITQYFEASKAIDELRRRYEETQRSLADISGKIPKEYQPFFQAYGEQYKNVFETTLDLAQTLLRSGQTEQALQLTTQAQPLATDFINKMFEMIQFEKQTKLQEREVSAREKQVEVTEKLGQRELDIKQQEIDFNRQVWEWEKNFKEKQQKLAEAQFEWSKIATFIDKHLKEMELNLKKYETDVRTSVEREWMKTNIQIANIRANAAKQAALIGLWRSIHAKQGGITPQQQAAFIAGMIDPNSVEIIERKGKKEKMSAYFDPTKFAENLANGRIELEIVGNQIIGTIFDENGNVDTKFIAKYRVPKRLFQKAYDYLLTLLKKPQVSMDEESMIDIDEFLTYDFE